MPITDDNRHLLRSGYEARTTDELPVLVRWFEGIEPPVADYLIAILYSREQLAKDGTLIPAEWGVVGCMYRPAGALRPKDRRLGWPLSTQRFRVFKDAGSAKPIQHASCHPAPSG